MKIAERIEEVSTLYATKTAAELAKELGMKGPALRQALHRYGVSKAEQRAKDRRVLRHLQSMGWSIDDIAEQMEKPASWVRRRTPVQLSLWPRKWYSRKPVAVLNVIHRAGRKVHAPSVQLALDLFPESLSVAA